MDGARRAAELRLDPLGLEHPDFAETAPAAPGDRLVLLLGDSRAYRWPVPVVSGHAFVNRGIPDQSTEQILARFDAHVAPVHPAVVVLQAGINDLKSIPLLPARRDEIVARCKQNLRALVARSRALGAQVVITTIFPTGEVALVRRPIWSDAIGIAVREVNDDLRTLAGSGVQVIDAWKLLENGQGELRPELGLDTLHLSARGYQLLDVELVSALSRTQ